MARQRLGSNGLPNIGELFVVYHTLLQSSYFNGQLPRRDAGRFSLSHFGPRSAKHNAVRFSVVLFEVVFGV
eukprot:12277626-Heterocapsa_arctica.AAC.1